MLTCSNLTLHQTKIFIAEVTTIHVNQSIGQFALSKFGISYAARDS